MHDAHRLDDLLLDLFAADDVVLRQEVIRHCDQRLFRPALEPVHGTARDETREFQGAASELLANLCNEAESRDQPRAER